MHGALVTTEADKGSLIPSTCPVNPMTPVFTLFSHRNNIALVVLSSAAWRKRVMKHLQSQRQVERFKRVLYI